MKYTFISLWAAALLAPITAPAAVIVSQSPVAGGGVLRWSQLWQDPGPDGNDLDGDSVCWEDFVLSSPATINHVEWWGAGASELGFQIEFWKQDPGTIAYQPLGIFYYGGVHTIVPEPPGFIRATPTTSPGPGGLTHYALDLASPVSLAANDAVNPRWFVAIIGLTSQPYVTWNWSQGLGGSTNTYQFLRGDGHAFRPLPEGRALVLQTAPDAGDFNGDAVVDGGDFLMWQQDLGAAAIPAGSGADGDKSGTIDAADLAIWQGAFGAGYSVATIGAVPEPGMLLLTTLAVVAMALRRRSQRCPVVAHYRPDCSN